eukprot:353330-Chlamydomonas_euryale.AAC.2
MRSIFYSSYLCFLDSQIGDQISMLTDAVDKMRTEMRTELNAMQAQILDIASTVETVKKRWGGGTRPDGKLAALARIQRGTAREEPWSDDESC